MVMERLTHNNRPHAQIINRNTAIVAIAIARETAIRRPAGNAGTSNSDGYSNFTPRINILGLVHHNAGAWA